MEGLIVENKFSKEKIKLISKLGNGRFGVVFRAQLVEGDRLVAVKVVHCNDVAVEEANIMRILFHPNVVKYHSFFVDADRSFISMELGKESVANVLNVRGRLSDTECRVFIRDILCGLVYLESKLIVHRDIKPHNLLLNNRNNISICDFGVTVKLTSKDQVIKGKAGTKFYLASVMVRGESYSFGVDRFSCGCCLYEFLVGKQAFDFGEVQPPFELAQRHIVEGKYSPLPRSCSLSGSDLVKKLMNPNPNERISCEDALRSSFLKDFFVLDSLPNLIATQPPHYYFFTHDTLDPLQSYMHSVHINLRKILSKALPVVEAPVVGIDGVAVDMSSMLFADSILYTGKCLGYHLTTGTFGLLFRHDHTSIIQTSIHGDSLLQGVLIDMEQNGRVVNESTAKGSALKKFNFFIHARKCMTTEASLQELELKLDNLTNSSEPLNFKNEKFDRVWKFYEKDNRIVFGLSNGSVQIIDSRDNFVFLLTRDHFIVTTDGSLSGQAYSWESLLAKPSTIHGTLVAQLTQSLTDFVKFVRR